MGLGKIIKECFLCVDEKSGTLLRDYLHQGRTYKRGSTVTYSEAGGESLRLISIQGEDFVCNVKGFIPSNLVEEIP